MTCRRSREGVLGVTSTLSGDLRVEFPQGIRSMLLDHFVVDTEQQERRRPLPNKKGMMIFSGGFQNKGAGNRCEGCAEKEAAGQFGGVALHEGCCLVFRDVSGAH